MTQLDKYNQAVHLLKELNCPEQIMEALWLFGLTVCEDETKLTNWLAPGGLIEGEVIEKE
jgi:hypothetical protein